MSFANAPVTRFVVVGLVATSIVASVLDIKHYFFILVDVHFWEYHQLWRTLAFQLCYNNSAEMLFGVMTLYNMRIVERMWGTRKYTSFLVMTTALTSIITPLVMTILRPLTGGFVNYLPAGPTPLIFAILAQYHSMVPRMYSYRIPTSTSAVEARKDEESHGITLTNKSLRYLLTAQLALSQWPGSVVGALVGWAVGSLWRSDFLPGVLTQWRIPGWLLGQKTKKSSGEYEGLRRRLEEESTTSARSTGLDSNDSVRTSQRRTVA